MTSFHWHSSWIINTCNRDKNKLYNQYRQEKALFCSHCFLLDRHRKENTSHVSFHEIILNFTRPLCCSLSSSINSSPSFCCRG